MKDKVSINILNFNTYEKACKCIDSCLLQQGSFFRILLIDNNSTDNSFILLKNKYKDKIEYFQTGDNYGYAGGNNKGVSKCIDDGYKYSLLLNSDTELVGASLLESLLQIIIKYQDCAIVAPLIFDVTSKGLIKVQNDSFYCKLLRLFRVLPYNKVIDDRLETKSEAHGSALFIDNNIFLECGGFPEHFFMYAEESLLSKKILWMGYTIYWLNTPDIYIKHHHDTTSYIDPWRLYLMGRNASLEYMENRNGKKATWLVAFCIFALRSFINSIINFNIYHFKGILDGLCLHFRHKDRLYIFKQGQQVRSKFANTSKEQKI